MFGPRFPDSPHAVADPLDDWVLRILAMDRVTQRKLHDVVRMKVLAAAEAVEC